MVKSMIKYVFQKYIDKLHMIVDTQFERHEWIQQQIADLEPGLMLLDAGCGNQRYRPFCEHLNYKAQDFGKYEKDEVASYTGKKIPYQYGQLDYVGDVWDIKEKDQTFDVILCSEVLEHIPYPNETLKEFHRLLKVGGLLILTVPANALRHWDPYFFISGYSNRYFEHILPELGFMDIGIQQAGDYYRWLAIELYRTSRIIERNILNRAILLPAFLFYLWKSQHPTIESQNTLCNGYFVTARKGP
ncbi:Ubiquinone biosynthesis O-methyltransferase, mitochondrial [subsurface metagenome]